MLSLGISLGFNTQSAFKDFVSNERNGTDWLGFDNGNRGLPKGFPSTAQAYRALGSTTAGVDQQIALSKLFRNDVYNEKKYTALLPPLHRRYQRAVFFVHYTATCYCDTERKE